MKKEKWFTGIEIVMVTLTVVVLVWLVQSNLKQAQARGRDAQRKADVQAIQRSLESFRKNQTEGEYPATDSWKEEVVGEALKEVPNDPLLGAGWSNYSYNREESRVNYRLMACLESKADNEKDKTNSCQVGNSYTLTGNERKGNDE